MPPAMALTLAAVLLPVQAAAPLQPSRRAVHCNRQLVQARPSYPTPFSNPSTLYPAPWTWPHARLTWSCDVQGGRGDARQRGGRQRGSGGGARPQRARKRSKMLQEYLTDEEEGEGGRGGKQRRAHLD